MNAIYLGLELRRVLRDYASMFFIVACCPPSST